MLELVAHDQLAQHAVTDAALGDHLRGARADGVHVLQRVGGAERLDLPAHGARRLERVVQVGEVSSQQLAATVAMAQPQVLIGGDVGEIPHQRAHDRRVNALELLVVELRHERQRALTRRAQRAQQLRGVAWKGGVL